MRRVVLKVVAVVAALLGIGGVLLAPAALASGGVPWPPSPGVPSGLNVLPSTIRGTLPLTGVPGQQQYLAVMLYRYAQSPAFWEAVRAQAAGTATTSQLALVQQRTESFTVPATKTASMLKVVGGAATAVSGFSIGTALGHGLLEVLGFNPEGMVCGHVSGVGETIVGVLTGADCAAFREMHEEFVANTDVVPGVSMGGESCNASRCVVAHEVTYYPWVTGSGFNYSKPMQRWCFVVTSGTGTAAGTNLWYRDGRSSGWWSTGIGTIGSIGGVGDCEWSGGVPGASGQKSIGEFGTVYEGFEWTIEGNPTSNPSVTTQHRVELSDDPARVLRCIVVTSDATLQQDSATFKESDGVLPEVVCPEIPEGAEVESITIREVNLEDGSWNELWSETTTAEYQAAIGLAPECMNGTCLLDLRLTVEDVSCFQVPEECADWYSDPNKGSKYSCYYGSHLVDLAECTVYAPTFREGASTHGNVYGDPDTGEPIGAPAGAATGADGSYFGAPVGDPSGDRACLPNGWDAFNPIEWIMRPVQCALEWAFVPRQQVVQDVGVRVATAWNGTLMAQAGEIVSAIPEALPSGVNADCRGPAVTFGEELEPFGMEGTWYPLSACDEPMATLAAVSRVAAPILLTIALVFAAIRYLAATIGFVGLGGSRGGNDE